MNMKPYTVYIRAVKGKSLIDRLIQWKTGSVYNHVEFFYPFDGTIDSVYKYYRNHLCVIGAHPHGGIQIRPFDYIGKVNYDVYSIKLTQKQVIELRNFCLSKMKIPYSWGDIFDDVFNVSFKLSHRAYDCSEFVAKALEHVGVYLVNRKALKQSYRITPRDICFSSLLFYEGVKK